MKKVVCLLLAFTIVCPIFSDEITVDSSKDGLVIITINKVEKEPEPTYDDIKEANLQLRKEIGKWALTGLIVGTIEGILLAFLIDYCQDGDFDLLGE